MEKDYGILTSNKRVPHLCKVLHIQSTVNHGYTKAASDPQITMPNTLHREFWAGRLSKKWLTDVSEFKWYERSIVHKLYLSATLNLCDRRIVSYVIRGRNDNKLVFDKAVRENPDAHPLFHSDRDTSTPAKSFTRNCWILV